MKSDSIEITRLSKDEGIKLEVESNNYFNIEGEKALLDDLKLMGDRCSYEVKLLKLSTPPYIVIVNNYGIIMGVSVERKVLDNLTEEKAGEAKEIFMLAKAKITELVSFAHRNNIE